MNRKTFFITTATSLASAVVLFSAPAQAQLLGGAGHLTGNMSGQIGRSTTGLTGALGGEGRLSGSLPRPEAGRVNGAIERTGDRAATVKDKAGAKAAAAADTLSNTSVSGGGSAAGDGSITTPLRSIDGGAAANGSGAVSRDGASAEAGGSARASARR